MQNLLFVGVGGALGAMARYLVGSSHSLKAWGGNWPHGTFIVNIVGGFLMGALAGWLAHRGGADQERWRLLLGVGVLGGFTTFSAYSLELALMVQRREYLQAGAYATVSVVLSVVALFVGLMAARRVFA